MSVAVGFVGVRSLDLQSRAVARLLRWRREEGWARQGEHLENGLALFSFCRPRPKLPRPGGSLPQGQSLILCGRLRLRRAPSLARRLGLSSAVSQEQLVMEAYRRWGEQTPCQLEGDFSFALWDSQRRSLLCARDPFGVFPFFYWAGREGFFFSTSLPALLALQPRAGEPDRHCLAAYLIEQPGPELTFYKGIRRLPAAHTLFWQKGRLGQRAYWSLDPSRKLPPAPDQEHQERFRSLFLQAVRGHLDGAPLGILVSGGLDSAAVACCCQQMGEVPTLLAGVFRDLAPLDERRYLQELARQSFSKPFQVQADGADALDWLEAGRTPSQPIWLPSLLLHPFLLQQARRLGLEVLLDGFDGDTVVSQGTYRLQELLHQGRYLTYWRQAGLLGSSLSARTRLLLAHGVREQLPPWCKGKLRALAGRPLPLPLRLLQPSFRKEEQLDRRWTELGKRPQPREEREQHFQMLSSPLHSLTLEYLDELALRHGVQLRHPFFQPELAELCLALPSRLKLDGGWDRLILRRALNGILPPRIQWRRDKADHFWLFHASLLRRRSRVEDLLFRAGSPLQEFYLPTALRDLYDGYLKNPRPGPAYQLWKALNLASWLQEADRISKQRTAA